jgi:transposase-like protein
VQRKSTAKQPSVKCQDVTPFPRCEALNKQIRRRTRVAAIFPNPESCLRLVSAILMEISEAWEASKAYLNPQLLK